MKRVTSLLGFSLVAGAAAALMSLGNSAALANTGPANGTTTNMTTHVIGLPAPTISSAIRYGKNVHIVWTYSGAAKNFYIFSFSTTSTPPNDFATGGWHNDLIAPAADRAIDDNVAEATKPNHNYYLICIAGQGTAYACSNVVMERPSMTAPAPILLNH